MFLSYSFVVVCLLLVCLCVCCFIILYRITSYLGSGEFGHVEKGLMRTSTGQSVDVAVKTLPMNATQSDKVRFLQEAAIMAQFKHPNVVKMYGVVKDGTSVSQTYIAIPTTTLMNLLCLSVLAADADC